MENYEQAVFISYAWGDKREEIVDQIDKTLQDRGIRIIRDKRDLGYKRSIREFMERIGQGNCVIVVISDKYLRSPNCMFELVEIAENRQFHNRTFPIVLADANIYNPIERIKYIKHWEEKRAELAEAMKTLDPANLQGIREDMDLYDRIRDKISGLTTILKDMNTLTAEMHRESDFAHLYDQIEERMKAASTSDEAPEVEAGVSISEAPTKAASGLAVLRELMQRSPDVRNAVIAFQTDFKFTHEQVDQLRDYKYLHDLLHRLQFSCYNGIVHAAASFPDSEDALDILNDHTLTFESIVDELKLVGSHSSMPKHELSWIDEVEQMHGDLRTALSGSDVKQLKTVIRRLERLLGTHPARINTLLNYAARALRLPELWSTLKQVCSDMVSLNLDTDKVTAFETGVKALGKLEKTLNDLVDEHDRWQSLEVELRLLETLVERDLDQFGSDWDDVRQKAEPLYIKFSTDWAHALMKDRDALDKAVDSSNPVKVRRSFRNYQRRVANRFYQVDLELKALCGNLQQIGIPLASVLEVIK